MCATRNQSLIWELRQYLLDKVEISQHEQSRATEVVEGIKRAFKQCNHGSSYDFGRIFHQGSSYEGLKVIKADEFDLLVPLNLNDQDWSIEQGTSGHYFIEKQYASAEATWDRLTDEKGNLNPAKVRRNMQSIVQRAVNGMSDFRINPSSHGPAITLDVMYDNSNLSIDIVPCFVLKGRRFVAKSPPQSLRNAASDVGLYDRMWRESFSEKEKTIIKQMDGMNECRRDCLKILKTIQKRRGSSQLGMLSSYHLKTCMLHLNDELHPDADRPAPLWHKDKLADRFKDLLKKLMYFLEIRNMPNFCCRSVNLFDRYGTDSLKNILGWLRGVTRNDDNIINELLHEIGFATPTPDNFEIFVVNIQGKTTVYRNMQKSTTVKQLKHEISTKEHIPVEQQRLTFESKPLEDGQTLGYYNIQQGSTLYLLGRLRGG